MNARVQTGWTRDSIGRLFSVQLSAGTATSDGRKPRGLFLQASNGQARIAVTVGDPISGARARRDFDLGNRGAWLSCAGWVSIEIEIVSLSTDARVEVSWTTEPPPSAFQLLLMAELAAGTFDVPAGAEELLPSANDAGWAWVTNTGGGALTLPQTLTAGSRVKVAGNQFTATGGQTVCWFLNPV